MAPSESKPSAFKLHLNGALVDRIAEVFSEASPSFDSDGFCAAAVDGLDDLELKARIGHIAMALTFGLPDSFPAAAAVMDAVLALPPGDNGHPGGLDGWESWPIIEWVGIAGRDHPAEALELMSRVTFLSTAEFAIRPYIDDDPGSVLERLGTWIDRDDEQVRRLVSEGTRPMLPWGGGLAVAKANPTYAVGLLDRLVDDPSEYVRRSVSNHLNDLCRVAPQDALTLARLWSTRADDAEASGDDMTAKNIRWVVTRGVRTLVKAGDPDAMALLGFDPDVSVDVGFEVLTAEVDFGGAAEWTIRIRSESEQRESLVVDYVVHFVRANGSTGPKVFKWTTMDLGPGEERTLTRRHKIVPITTRTYHSGVHRVEIQVNGRVVADGEFELHTS